MTTSVNSEPSQLRKDPLAVEIGRRLRQARVETGLEINDVRAITGWDRQTIGSWENGYAFIPVKKLRQLCKLYRVSIDWVVNGNPPDGEWEGVLDTLPDTIRANAKALAERPRVNEVVNTIRNMSDEELAIVSRILPALSKLGTSNMENVAKMLSGLVGILDLVVRDQ